MAFTAKDVAKLREMTNVGMMDCKKALSASDGDMDKAIEWLRERGLAAAAKKSGRIAAEGVAYAAIIDGIGVIVEVNSETDFAAKSPIFTGLVEDVAKAIAAENPADVDALLKCTYPGSDKSIEAMLPEKILVIGENVKIRRFARFADGVSVPYVHMGRMARVIFTRSRVKIYVDNRPVASHTRKHEYGYTYEPEHLASGSLAIMERSAAYYISWAGRKSEDCKAYIEEIFNPERTNKPEEVYYRLCAAILSSYKKYEGGLVDLTCRQCLDNRIFTYKKFEAILKNNHLTQSSDEPCLFAPVPTDHANMRGSGYFK